MKTNFFPELIIYIIAIAACLYGCYVLSKFVAKKMNRTMSGNKIKVIERVAFGQDKCIALCNICGNYFVIGVSNQNIKILLKLDESYFENEEAPPKANFADMFQSALKTTIHKSKNNDSNQFNTQA
ncbi:flagellar biosynthetic protein FliO [Paludicola sp. MB14-C6]|uniref:flagellar biosynthetic protein FliO n=1 Tax=Paludihabitans sp. MB14-C6 TaxID=3070656 RepID=UPI0027DBD454|nr:flagellar biosynthetic protein FliO [Paludicola sp. MB14-C6]WMJ24236.1 flagellar biosynthetic protein FliO [Paludicola sp. MB14-C6]